MSEDLIKRSDAIKAVRSVTGSYVPFLSGINVTLPIECEIALQAVPSADRPQGEWIPDKHKNIWDMDVDCYKCSVCGRYTIHRSLIMDTKGLSYCPNCGARMKGADDE
jgi:DNA-directed RNA polymerase subunit RPC12/RpoP